MLPNHRNHPKVFATLALVKLDQFTQFWADAQQHAVRAGHAEGTDKEDFALGVINDVVFRGLANEGKSVILSSHVLHEVESLTDTMVLIHRGRLLAQGSVRDVRRLINKHPSRVHVKAREPRRQIRAAHPQSCTKGFCGA